MRYLKGKNSVLYAYLKRGKIRFPSLNSSRFFMLQLTVVLLLTLISSCGDDQGPGASTGGEEAARDDVILLPDGFRPEGVAIGGGSLFAGSIPTGNVFRADIETGQGEVFIRAAEGRKAIGMKVDGRNHLFVAGGDSGQAYVYNAATGQEIAMFTLAQGNTFINDVAVTTQAAWFTDSQNPVIYKVPIKEDGSPGTAAEVVSLPLTGDMQMVADKTNANGIAAASDGSRLIIVQTATGMLFTVDPDTGATSRIDLGAENVENGDGLLLQGQTLYVVQNRSNQVAVLTLDAAMQSATVRQRIGNDAFDVPTTVAASDGSLYVVNARFGIEDADTAAYSVIRVGKP